VRVNVKLKKINPRSHGFFLQLKQIECEFAGCVWINLGPLLYHFADILDEDSIEPSYEVVRYVIEKVGFVIEVSIWK